MLPATAAIPNLATTVNTRTRRRRRHEQSRAEFGGSEEVDAFYELGAAMTRPTVAVCNNDDEARWCQSEPINQKCRNAKPRRKRSQHKCRLASPRSAAFLLFHSILAIPPASAVLLPFSNCLDDSYIYSNQQAGSTVQLQWMPLYLDAVFDTAHSTHNLKVTVWGNVTGQVGTGILPEWDNATAWNDPNNTDSLRGKIRNVPEPELAASQRKMTTLFRKVDVLEYEQYSTTVNFCDSLTNASCPLGPVFNTTPIVPPFGSLPSFNFSNNFDGSYAFSSFTPSLVVLYGDQSATQIGCVTATLTPSQEGISWFLKFLPLIVLILVGFATAFAGVFSPWGSSDVFYWTSNYGRDPDLLRLVTPGFGDCLQYIQFVVLTAGLSLDYPGFYQPALSNGAWSVLMFNQSFVSHAPSWVPVVDGLYYTNGTYGIQNLAQLVGMSQVEDVWPGMMIWLLVIIACLLAAIQLVFLFRWLRRFLSHEAEEDHRAKNFPFSVGNVIRLVFGYFLLPIVALSTFQLVVAPESQMAAVAMAAVTIILVVGFAAWLMHLIASTRPRAHLFDDLPTVLLYGSLYNTYSDGAATFALIPIILTIIKGVAIGAVQPSGIAQLVILAICEVVQVLTILFFRPFHSPTSMNAYHTGFSVLRFISVMLMVAFAPSMEVADSPKGWIGYAILLIHGTVLVIGFCLNALQTIIEVIARLYGAGGDDVNGQQRGGLSKIFGARQLQRRTSRRGGPSRLSQRSSAVMLDAKKGVYGRVRSSSAGSMGVYMHNHMRDSSALDGRSIDAFSGPPGTTSAFTPTTIGNGSFSVLPPPAPGQATRPPQPTADPYYRPPRARRMGDESESPHREDGSYHKYHASVDAKRVSMPSHAELDATSGRVTSTHGSYIPLFAPRQDYSTREVDFYYGVRGPALNSEAPSRRMGTGPADPTSPIRTARGWLKGMFGGKTKEKGKGFEVVRSARVPPTMKVRGTEISDEAPEGIPVAMGVLRNGPIDSDDEDSTPKPRNKAARTGSRRHGPSDSRGNLLSEEEEDAHAEPEADEEDSLHRHSPLIPDLNPVPTHSSATTTTNQQSSGTETHRRPSQRTIHDVKIQDSDRISIPPEVPRKSSRRDLSQDRIKSVLNTNLIPPSEASSSRSHTPTPSHAPSQGQAHGETAATSRARYPFDRSNSQKRLSGASSMDIGSQLPSTAGGGASVADEDEEWVLRSPKRSLTRVDPDPDGGQGFLESRAELFEVERVPSEQSFFSARSR